MDVVKIFMEVSRLYCTNVTFIWKYRNKILNDTHIHEFQNFIKIAVLAHQDNLMPQTVACFSFNIPLAVPW